MTKDFFFFLLPKFRKCVQHVLVVSVEDGNGEMMEEQFRSELLRQVVSIKDFFQPSILGTIFGRSGLDISRYLDIQRPRGGTWMYLQMQRRQSLLASTTLPSSISDTSKHCACFTCNQIFLDTHEIFFGRKFFLVKQNVFERCR